MLLIGEDNINIYIYIYLITQQLSVSFHGNELVYIGLAYQVSEQYCTYHCCWAVLFLYFTYCGTCPLPFVIIKYHLPLYACYDFMCKGEESNTLWNMLIYMKYLNNIFLTCCVVSRLTNCCRVVSRLTNWREISWSCVMLSWSTSPMIPLKQTTTKPTRIPPSSRVKRPVGAL